MNTSLLKYSLLTLLIGMSNISISFELEIAKEIKEGFESLTHSDQHCPAQEFKNVLTSLKKSSKSIIFATLSIALAVWVFKLRSRGPEWTSRFDKSKLTTDTFRQIWYFIADEILGHAGEVTKVKLQHATTDGIYEVDAEKEVCLPHGAVGCALGYAQEIMTTKDAAIALAGLFAWISAHEGHCPCTIFKN